MNDTQPQPDLDKVITAACNALMADFERLNGLLVEPHPEMAADDVARNLVEFGRGQISGESEPPEQDRELIARIVAGLDLEGRLAPRFYAYLSGCVMGWIALGELPQDRLETALAVVRTRSLELFPPATEEGDENLDGAT